MADDQSDTSETLFSFEVFVEYIRIHKSCIVKNSLKPAVGVRLLDFPTLLIYQGEQGAYRQQEDSDSEKENATNLDVLLQSPTNRTVEYSFRKGKSCLFKINLDLLHTYLSNVPLYIMVLDSRNEIPKCLGSSMVTLAKLIDRIKVDVKHLSMCTPSAQGEKGLFAINNLMGERIGCISLGYKLLSLGASLIRHIPESRVLQIGTGKTAGKQTLKPSDNIQETTRCRGEDVLVMSSHQPDSLNVLCQDIELDGQQANVVASNTDTKRDHGVSTGTQTESTKRNVKSIEVEQIDIDNERNLSIFCPPPLYYSRPERRQDEGDADRCRLVNIGMEALRVKDLHLGEEGRKEGQDISEESQSAVYPEEVLTRSRTVQQTQGALALLGEALRPLPLLSALLAELSQLNGQPQQFPVSAAPNPDGLYQPAPECPHTYTPDTRPRLQPRRPCLSPTLRSRRSPIPQLTLGKLLVNSVATLSTSPKELSKAKGQSPRPENGAPKSSPKRKLVYGLTNTVRLRLRQTNPAVLREHERREQLRRSQSELLKWASRRPHRPTTTEEGHKITSSHRGQVLKTSINLDENIQTLVNSVDDDTPRTRTPPSQTRVETGGGPWAGNSGNEKGGGFPSSPPYDLVSKITVKRNPELRQNQTVRVHIPSGLSQNSHSDHRDGGRALSDASDTQLSLACPGFPSAENCRGAESGSLVQHSCSHSCRDTPDPGDYPDDSTSLEPTEGLSPDLPSSPEPALGSISIRASGSDSPSQGSWRPDLPVPVKAGGSPQRSLKGTHIIRARTQASAISLSSYDSRCASASAGSIRSRRQGSGAASGATRGPSVCEEVGGSGSQLSECFQHSPSARGSREDSHLLSDDSEPESVPSPLTERREETRDELGSLGFSNKYHHISELVLNGLPGYTL